MFFLKFSQKLKPILPTWRRRTRYVILSTPNIDRKLRLTTTSTSGRNATGKRVINTKCHSRKFKTPLYGFLHTLDTSYYIKYSKFNLKSNRFYNVWYGNLGSIKVLPAVRGSCVGSRTSLLHLDKNKLKILQQAASVRIKQPFQFNWPALLAGLPFFYKISNIFSKTFKPKYTTAGGTHSVKLQAEKREKCIKVRLVSGSIKFFDKSVYCLVGVNIQTNKHNYIVGKAGNNINIGKNKLVRGVAMNPVDHPNGGRTKSCSPELSPWGWVAKLNK